jgi:hypothetical protein
LATNHLGADFLVSFLVFDRRLVLLDVLFQFDDALVDHGQQMLLRRRAQFGCGDSFTNLLQVVQGSQGILFGELLGSLTLVDDLTHQLLAK